MMKNLMEYKGYHAKVDFYTESMTLRGVIEGINDYVDFETNNISDIENEFHLAVDDYLGFCAEVGKEPEKEYKGTFNVRIDPKLHKELAFRAFKDGLSLNSEVEKAIEEFVDRDQTQTRALAENVKQLTETIRMENAKCENEKIIHRNNIIQWSDIKQTYRDEAQTL